MCPYPINVNGFLVPCGKCGNCMKRKLQDWAIRCQIEARNSLSSYFITLTYQETDGKLSKDDLQRYFKRLRKHGYEFTYFALGDYGDTFGRPHYHVLLFNKASFDSTSLADIWQSGQYKNGNVPGFVRCDKISHGRIRYVVSYGLLAKLDWDKTDDRVKPFFLMSKRPAIGKGYLSPAIVKYHQSNKAFYYMDGGYRKVLPRYLRDKIFDPVCREVNNKLASVKALQTQSVVLDEIRRTNPNINPLLVYDKRASHSADVYLYQLRLKKNSKNKNK